MSSQKVTQEHTGFSQTINSWLPADLNTLIFVVLTLICTVVGVIYFAHTGNPFLLMTLWGTFASKAGLSKVTSGLLGIFGGKEQAPQEEPVAGTSSDALSDSLSETSEMQVKFAPGDVSPEEPKAQGRRRRKATTTPAGDATTSPSEDTKPAAEPLRPKRRRQKATQEPSMEATPSAPPTQSEQ